MSSSRHDEHADVEPLDIDGVETLDPITVPPPDPTTYTAAESSFDRYVLESPERVRAAMHRLGAELDARGVRFGSQQLPASIKPHFVPQSVHSEWVTAAERLFSILETSVEILMAEPRLFDKLGLPPGTRELVQIDPGYRRTVIIGRPDCVWQGRRLRVLEINCESPAMMTYADVVQEVQRELFPLQAVEQEVALAFPQRTPALLQALLACYREAGGDREAPTIALVDWGSEKTRHEQRCTADRFTALGVPALICQPHELSIVNGRLTAEGREIDIVQRRVLFNDFLRRPDELKTLVEAYRRGLVCMANPLRSCIVGNKSMLALLCDEDLRTQLDEVDRRLLDHVLPATHVIDGNRDVLRTEREQWVLKPSLGHGGEGVLIGREAEPARWSDRIDKAVTERWVAQRLQQIPSYDLPEMVDDGGLNLARHHVNWAPFCFGGRFAGAITRASLEWVVSITAHGALLPTVAVEG